MALLNNSSREIRTASADKKGLGSLDRSMDDSTLGALVPGSESVNSSSAVSTAVREEVPSLEAASIVQDRAEVLYQSFDFPRPGNGKEYTAEERAVLAPKQRVFEDIYLALKAGNLRNTLVDEALQNRNQAHGLSLSSIDRHIQKACLLYYLMHKTQRTLDEVSFSTSMDEGATFKTVLTSFRKSGVPYESKRMEDESEEPVVPPVA